jgi:hypothetical protein
MEVGEYTIIAYKMCLSTLNGEEVIRVKIFFCRHLTNFLLTTCLPTLMSITIGHASNYFGQAHFETAIGVNLTLMLVLTTM